MQCGPAAGQAHAAGRAEIFLVAAYLPAGVPLAGLPAARWPAVTGMGTSWYSSDQQAVQSEASVLNQAEQNGQTGLWGGTWQSAEQRVSGTGSGS